MDPNPNPPEYQYKPLTTPGHFRILILYPRFGFGPVCCSLWQVSHCWWLLYNAISYTWGANSSDATERILIDGCTKFVSRSVFELLCSQSSLLPRLLWIDALCVDQGNNLEKNQQVPRMDDIYRNALFTTVFLGRSPMQKEVGMGLTNPSLPFRYDGLYSTEESIARDYQGARLAFDFLREIHLLGISTEACASCQGVQKNVLDFYQSHEVHSPATVSSSKWIALARLLQHSWFERVWIIQEVALSPVVFVQHGDETIEWDVLARGIESLYSSRDLILWLEFTHGVKLRDVRHTSLYNVVKIQRLRKLQYGDKSDRFSRPTERDSRLANLLPEMVSFQATNPRDLIYGLNSLCSDPLQTEYNLSVEDVYLRAAERLFRANAIEFVFHNSGVGNRLESNPVSNQLPSWTPNWTDVPQYEQIRGNEMFSQTYASTTPSGTMWRCTAEAVLETVGTRWDTVDCVGPVLYTRQENMPALEEMRQLADVYHEAWTFISTHPATTGAYASVGRSESLLHAFRRALTHSDTSLLLGKQLDDFLEWEIKLYKFRVRVRGTPHAIDEYLATYDTIRNMDDVAEVIRTSCGGKRIFITKKGYIGLCPPYTARGDAVYTLSGQTVPVLMRWSSENKFELVGQCYYHRPAAAAEQTLNPRVPEPVEII